MNKIVENLTWPCSVIVKIFQKLVSYIKASKNAENVQNVLKFCEYFRGMICWMKLVVPINLKKFLLLRKPPYVQLLNNCIHAVTFNQRLNQLTFSSKTMKTFKLKLSISLFMF